MRGNLTKCILQHNNMKKNFFRAVALSALLAMGVNGAQAQSRTYDCPPLNPEYQALAEQVVSLNMEDPDKANKVYMSLSKKIKKRICTIEERQLPISGAASAPDIKVAPTSSPLGAIM